MDRLFKRMINKVTPKFNPDIMNGYSMVYRDKCDEWVIRAFESVAKSLPEGIKYTGTSRCGPFEEFEEVTRPRSGKRVFDFATSSLTLLKNTFSYREPETGRIIPFPPRYVYRLFWGPGGVFHLSGTKCHITPVLSDKVISPGSDNVFVRLFRDKITIRRLYHDLKVDGRVDKVHVVWSQIHRNENNKSMPKTTKARSCLAHYLFAKHGVRETFQKYLGFIPVFGTKDITEKNYPSDQWVICSTSGTTPKTYLSTFYTPPDIRIAIPREHWNNTTKSLVVGFYYVVDHFPERLTLEAIDEKDLWIILLGHILYTGLYQEDKLFQKIMNHFNSLDDYLDVIVQEKLAEIGYRMSDFYDLLMLVLGNFNEFILSNKDNINNVYGKNLEVLYYLLYDITSGIFNMGFKLANTASKRRVSFTEAQEILNRCIKPRGIYGLMDGKIVCEPVSSASDCIFFKLTSHLTEQEANAGPGRAGSGRLSVGLDEHLHPSQVEVGSVLNLPKACPKPTQRVNPFLQVDNRTGTVLQSPDMKETIEYIAARFKRHIPRT